jgi:diadenylate cyclase
MKKFQAYLEAYTSEWYLPDVRITDVIEIIIIAVVLYHLMLWIKNTKAWVLLKGVAVLLVFILIAAVFKMNTILWIAKNSINVLATVAIVVFQPELRRALEQLGQHQVWKKLIPISFERVTSTEKFSEHTIDSIVTACYEMGKVKTGALIVVERDILLTEYQNTGIAIDSLVSSQLLINIFEHNTPLHDGAMVIEGNKIQSAGVLLPLTEDPKLSWKYGTRHRAALGMSEVSDAACLVVSEETGDVSICLDGMLKKYEDLTTLKADLVSILGIKPTEIEMKHKNIFDKLRGK